MSRERSGGGPESGKVGVRLVRASLSPPAGLADLLADLGDGENGFNGTPVPSGEMTLDEFLRQCWEMTDASKVVPPKPIPSRH